MTERELRNLQVYIGKRNQGQTDEQVIAHIDKINQKASLTQEEWQKLIFPCCNNGYVTVLKYVLAHITTLYPVLDYMKHTVYGRNVDIQAERIEVLEILIPYITDNKVQCLSETMIHAAWFGETEIVKFLIASGADKAYENAKGLRLNQCAERVERIFHDDSLRCFLAKQ